MVSWLNPYCLLVKVPRCFSPWHPPAMVPIFCRHGLAVFVTNWSRPNGRRGLWRAFCSEAYSKNISAGRCLQRLEENSWSCWITKCIQQCRTSASLGWQKSFAHANAQLRPDQTVGKTLGWANPPMIGGSLCECRCKAYGKPLSFIPKRDLNLPSFPVT